MAVGLPSLKFLLLKVKWPLCKGQTIMATLLVLMAENAMDVVVTIFTLTVLDSNRTIPSSMVDMEDMLGVFMTILEEIVTTEDTTMVPVAIAPMVAVVLTVNLWLLGNIFILLMKIQSLRFLVQPGSATKSVSALL